MRKPTGIRTCLLARLVPWPADAPGSVRCALHCRALLEHHAAGLLTAAEGYTAVGRPLLAAQALEAGAEEFLRTDDRDQARAAFIRATDLYTSLGALMDIARVQAAAGRLWGS
jgi:hypothetical protein